jgi:glucokinase
VLGPNSFLAGWEGENPAADLSALFGVTVAMENDADAAALAEAAWGAGRGISRMLYVTVSTGIGSGLVLDGRIYRGVDGAHPEIGHLVIDPDGPLCTCGARGCFESICSGPALAAWYARQPGAVEVEGRPVDARRICQMATEGDSLARAAVDRVGFYLGIGIANLVNAYIPGMIVLGGGVMESWHLFEAAVRNTIRTNCSLVPWEKTELRRASLGAKTGLSGAARVWLHRFYPESG